MNRRTALSPEEIEHLLEYEEIPDDPTSSDDESSCDEGDMEIMIDENFEILEEFTEETSKQVDSETIPEEVVSQTQFIPKWRKKVYDIYEGISFEGNPDGFPKGEVCSFSDATPVDIFCALCTEENIDHMVYQTNLYATQQMKPYKPTNNAEIKEFVAINFLMGIKPLPSYTDYWSSDLMMRDQYIANIMSLARFKWFLKHLHLNDNTKMKCRDDEDYDKLYKVRPFIDSLNKSFLESYDPSQNIAIDESMIKFKGRSSMKQYMPNKPIKRGYKVWVRADHCGFISNFEIYTGKSNATGVEHGLGGRVVLQLCSTLNGKGYRVFADNFFSSVGLAHELGTQGLAYCGTIRSNRKFLPELCSDKEMKRGQFDWRMDPNGISIVKWIDTKAVRLISNSHDPSDDGTVERKEKDGSRHTVSCPKVVMDYRKYMGGVDKADMLKSYYELDRKSKKWWHRIYFHFMDVTVVNSYIIYRKLLPSVKISMKGFRQKLIHGLVGCKGYISAKKTHPRQPSISSPLVKRHKTNIPVEIRKSESKHMPKNEGKMRRCNLCSTKKEPRRTSFICSVCNVPLCCSKKRDCFASYHS